MSVLDRVPGQEAAVAFLRRAVQRPHHAYVFAGPEGSGKQLAARAFAAVLLCAERGCGDCRACRLALGDRHPNVVVVEPEGRDIRVGSGGDEHGTARWMVAQSNLTAPEPGHKIFRVEQADRMTEEAADVLLKALEEPPPDTVFILSSARPDELPETVRSRCHVVTFHPLAEALVVETLRGEGLDEARARVASRLAGGNVGRARRVAADDEGLSFRDAALAALQLSQTGASGALAAAEQLIAASQEYRKSFGKRLEEELEPYLDPDTGAPMKHLRAEARRVQERHQRRERRAERDFLDWALMALETWFRDALLSAAGGEREWAINLDVETPRIPATVASEAIAVLEEARAALADETNLNARLVLERAFLALSSAGVPA
ncbi:MAG TPA: AAA family ATPase [Actinomycetota bacterium]|nr:AAA family ATPase [Actinomycetota bacterium]